MGKGIVTWGKRKKRKGRGQEEEKKKEEGERGALIFIAKVANPKDNDVYNLI